MGDGIVTLRRQEMCDHRTGLEVEARHGAGVVAAQHRLRQQRHVNAAVALACGNTLCRFIKRAICEDAHMLMHAMGFSTQISLSAGDHGRYTLGLDTGPAGSWHSTAAFRDSLACDVQLVAQELGVAVEEASQEHVRVGDSVRVIGFVVAPSLAV